MRRLFGLILLSSLLAAVLAGCVPRVQKPGPRTGVLAIQAGAIATADGIQLPLRRWGPEKNPRAIIVALHGFNDYSRAFAAPATDWAKAGIATWAYDQRGFGAAPGRGLWAGTRLLTGDLRAFAAALRRRYPATPLYLLGHSMGAAVVLASIDTDFRAAIKPAGIFLVAPAVWGFSQMNIFYRGGLWLAAHTVPWKRFTGQSLDIMASDNIPMLRRLGRDPLVIKETRVDTIYGLVGLMDRGLENAPALAGIPVEVLYGKHDQVIPEKAVRALAKKLPAGKCLRIFPRGYHMLLRDLSAAVVRADIARRVSGDGGGGGCSPDSVAAAAAGGS